jgi:hypothetical protein
MSLSQKGGSIASSGNKGEKAVMKMNRSLIKSLVVTVAALCWSAGLASAQSAIKGEFTLPFEARWGQAVLPAGEYSFDLASTRVPEVVQIRGEGKNVMIMAQGTSDIRTSENSALTVAQIGDVHVVRSLRLAPLGVTLHYAPHKVQPQAVAQMPEHIEGVPVRVAVK